MRLASIDRSICPILPCFAKKTRNFSVSPGFIPGSLLPHFADLPHIRIPPYLAG